ncbi:uncharacterized protein LOC116196305 [Punica granatum]|uniref:Uncharacterized protein LOC116196305 n=2 Tax=Punica granatum TaxID=22663 RepID=A0A6P8CNM4_PUNGR|nr:uncharacterized protein LOC116196305 [Punica granatum]XP_031381823.1 uncharacterized protein LOC116196305 [Punica granatum]OWM70170.1 hypothetical protein CDL15_Pgr026020 [Punica granatum]PKI43251.1 hypothetical protein CRG98_036337 [Punica granatum]
MPPEPLPWDRKDFFKERKHERSESLGTAPRWRESSSSHHGGSRSFPRWGSADFRRPPGHGKQGGWHLFPDESGHAYMPSRSADKFSEDDGGRRSVFRGDGKYSRSYRDNRVSFAQRDWKSGHSWETSNGSLHTPSRPNDMSSNNPRSVDVVTYTPPHSDPGNAWDSRQLHLKDQHEKVNGVDGLNTGQKCDGENPLGCLEWKPLKWSRSGSLSSRGSGLSHSSSSKSMGGVDSNEAKVGSVSVNVINSVQSPSGDAAVCANSTAPSEEMTSRKKPRLGWGEGLAKYEKKKVEGPDEVASRNGLEVCHSLGVNVADKSPRVVGFSDCASPATPSSVACSSSPGVEEKSFVKNINVDNEVNNLCESPGPASQNRQEGVVFNLEKLDMSSVHTLGHSLAEFLQSDDASSVDYSFVRSTAINKLILLKDDALKALEVTEMEIDKLENELKLLTSDSRNNCLCTASSSSPSAEGKAGTLEDKYDASNLITRPAPLQIVSAGDVDRGGLPPCNGDLEERHANIKDEDVDSPGTVTSKFVEPTAHATVPASSNVFSQSKCSEDLNAMQSTGNERDQSVFDSLIARTGVDNSTVVDGMKDNSVNDVSALSSENMLCQSILTANKEAASKASEALLMLLPRNEAKVILGGADVTCDPSDSSIKEKFAMRKRLSMFKERAITLKFKALHHLWKEDMRLPSLRKSRVKSQKKFESSLRIILNGYQKHRSSIRSHFSSPVGNLSLVPTKEVVSYASKLLSDPQAVCYRSNLKMPAMILDEREKTASSFISNNGLVEDPCAFEKERAVINPWTPEEREIFLDKLAAFGKDFRKIASFLDHKTTADCVQFYYKNRKSDCFERTKKKLEFGKQGKSFSNNTYLVTSAKKWNREMNTVSLDVLGDASLLAAQSEGKILEPKMFSGMFSLGGCSNSRLSEGDCGVLERTSSLDTLGSDREAVAADVLAGICGSFSSEAMSSCITSSHDPGELKNQKADAVTKRPLPSDVMENLEDETCSGESCGEMEPSDWTDEEKAALVQAVSSYGKDFAMISRCVRTRSVDQCKVFFSKARKCLGLDVMHPQAGPTCSPPTDDDNGGVDSDVDDTCALGNRSAVCSDKAGSKMEELPLSVMTRAEDDVSDPLTTLDLQNEANRSENVRMDVEEEVKGVEGSFCDTSKYGPMLVEAHVYHVSEQAGPEESAAPVTGAEVGSSTGLGTPSEPKSVQEDSHPSSSSSPSVVEEPLLAKKGENNRNDGSGTQCVVQVRDAGVDTSNPDVGMGGVLGFNLNSDSKGSMLDSVETPSFKPLPQEKAATTCQSEHRSTLDRVSSGGFDLSVSAEKLGFAGIGHSLNGMESSQILRGYPIQVPTEEMNRDSSHCPEFLDSQSLPKSDSSFTAQCMPSLQDCFLRKCSTANSHSSVSEHPLGKQSSNQRSSLPNSHVQSSTETDKPSGTGDFKLFGQILSNPPPQQKPNSNNHESDEKGPLQTKFTVSSSSSTPTSSLNGDGSSTMLKYDRNGYMGLSNIPLRSYGFWDGSKIQTGFSTLPDSSLLLAKYPAAFSNYPVSASKVDPQPLHAAVSKTSDLNGFTAKELSNGNGAMDYQVFRARDSASKVQPFTLEMKQRQDNTYPDLPRCNGFEAISGIQQPAVGMIAMNVVGRGVLVGGPCNGVSDPVTAIKMHYAQSEQLGGGAGGVGTGNITREDELWRGKGDVGR